MNSPSFDITSVTDVIVPIYSVIIFLFIIAYQKSPETKSEDRYFLKKVVKVTEKKNWRELMTGFFHQSDSSGFDDWLKFIEKPFAIRMIAPVVFHKIFVDMKLTETGFIFQRSWSSSKDKEEPPITLTLGTSLEDAPPFNYVVEGKPEDCGVWKGWVVEGEERVQVQFVPNNALSNPVLHVIREVVDQDTVLLSWVGEYKGKTCEMTSTYRRV